MYIFQVVGSSGERENWGKGGTEGKESVIDPLFRFNRKLTIKLRVRVFLPLLRARQFRFPEVNAPS